MNTEVKTVNQDLVPFDQARAGVVLLRKALDEIEVKDRETRDNAFNVCRGSSRILKKISEVRIDCIRSLKEDIKKNQKEADDKNAPIKKRIADIETYANEGLSEELGEIVRAKQTVIMVWDAEERERQETERRRIEEEERRQRKEQERKEKAIREAEARRLAKIEADKQKSIREAEKKKGIERVKAQREAEERARIASERASEEAAEKAQETRIDGAMERTEIVDKKEELESAKTSGRVKQEISVNVQDISKVPFEFLLNPRADVQKLIKYAKAEETENRVPQVPGILFAYSGALKYH